MSRRQRAVGVVVDASIARAAGPGDRPPAPACLQALQAMLEAGLFAVVCDELHDEWRRHGSRAFNRWRKQMHSRRLVRKIALTHLAEYVTHARRKRGRAPGVLAAVLSVSLVDTVLGCRQLAPTWPHVVRLLLFGATHLAAAGAEGRLFEIDYGILDGLPAGTFPGAHTRKYVVAPLAV